jgi:hypothetical protein
MRPLELSLVLVNLLTLGVLAVPHSFPFTHCNAARWTSSAIPRSALSTTPLSA